MSAENVTFSDGGQFAEAMLAALQAFCSTSAPAKRHGLVVDSIQAGDNPFVPSLETRVRVTRPVCEEKPKGVRFRAVGDPILTFTFVSSISVEQNIKEFERFISARLAKPISAPRVIQRKKAFAV